MKKKIKSVVKWLIWLLVIWILIEGYNNVRIKQSVHEAFGNSVTIETQVTVYQFYIAPKSMEYWKRKTVNIKDADSVRKIEYQKAKRIQKKLRKFY